MKAARTSLGQFVKNWAGDPEERLVKNSFPEGDCIVYRPINRHGYGSIHYRSKRYSAHRVAFALAHGPIPKGLNVCHRCDNRACIKIEHLFLGTQADNIADMVAKGRHLTGSKNPASRLTAANVEAIRALRTEGKTQLQIATIFGVNRAHISNILRGKRWAA